MTIDESQMRDTFTKQYFHKHHSFTYIQAVSNKINTIICSSLSVSTIISTNITLLKTSTNYRYKHLAHFYRNITTADWEPSMFPRQAKKYISIYLLTKVTTLSSYYRSTWSFSFHRILLPPTSCTKEWPFPWLWWRWKERPWVNR